MILLNFNVSLDCKQITFKLSSTDTSSISESSKYVLLFTIFYTDK